MSEIQNQIEKLKTLQESYDVLTDAVETQLPALDAALHEESVAIQTKIDNIDLSSVAKQGENQEATNSKILEEVGNASAALTAINEILGTL